MNGIELIDQRNKEEREQALSTFGMNAGISRAN